MNDDKKHINYIPVDHGTFDWLVRMANQAGTRVADFAGEMLDHVAWQDWSPPEPGSSNVDGRIKWLEFEAKRRQKRHEMVYRAASIYLEDLSEQAAEQLNEMCELAGLAPEEVLEEVRSDPMSMLVRESLNGTKFGRCTQWLCKLLTGAPEVAVADVETLALDKGYNMVMVVGCGVE